MGSQINPAQIAAISLATSYAAEQIMATDSNEDGAPATGTGAEVLFLGIDVRLWIVGICVVLMVGCVVAALVVFIYVLVITMQ